MKVKLRDIADTAGYLSEICHMKMKATSAFKFNKLKHFINENLELLNETKDGIIEKYSLRQPDGTIKVPEDLAEEVNREFSSTLDIEIDYDDFGITLKDFEGLEVSPNTISVLSWVIK